MEIEFDPAKDAENIRKHGISLNRASEVVTIAQMQDSRFDYGEIRHRAYGYIGSLSYCFVFTLRNDTIRVISLRRARAKEMRRYAPQKE
jgi:uncharacterized DUF497 family protein